MHAIPISYTNKFLYANFCTIKRIFSIFQPLISHIHFLTLSYNFLHRFLQEELPLLQASRPLLVNDQYAPDVLPSLSIHPSRFFSFSERRFPILVNFCFSSTIAQSSTFEYFITLPLLHNMGQTPLSKSPCALSRKRPRPPAPSPPASRREPWRHQAAQPPRAERREIKMESYSSQYLCAKCGELSSQMSCNAL